MNYLVNRTNLKSSHLSPTKVTLTYIYEKPTFWLNLALQKQKKMDFLPNLELPDLAEHGQGLPQDPPTIPNKPFQWATHKNKNLLPAWCVIREETINVGASGNVITSHLMSPSTSPHFSDKATEAGNFSCFDKPTFCDKFLS